MLQKISDSNPPQNDLQQRLDRFPELLAAPVLSGALEAAQRAFRDAGTKMIRARSDLVKVREVHRPVKMFDVMVEHPKVMEAIRAVEAAEAEHKRAGKRVNDARDRASEKFVSAVAPKLEIAAPTLLEVSELLRQAIVPLHRLQFIALNNQVSSPRLLAAAPALDRLSRQITTLLNDATAPQPPRDDLED